MPSAQLRRLSKFSVLAALSFVACDSSGNGAGPGSRQHTNGAGSSAANGRAASPVVGTSPPGSTPVLPPVSPGVVAPPPLAPQGDRTMQAMNDCEGKIDATLLATLRRTELTQ